MRTAILALAVLAAPAFAASAAERMSDSDYLRANRCVAYAGKEAGALGDLVKSEGRGRHEVVRAKADDERSQIVRKVGRARSAAQQEEVAADRAEICAPFADRLAAKPAGSQS